MTEQLLTVAQVANVCQCSTRTVMRAIDAGDLRASQLASRGVWRITAADIDSWLELRANRPRADRHIVSVPPQRSRSGPRAPRLSDLITDDMGRDAG
jgi:excisionase family DNA binding protein